MKVMIWFRGRIGQEPMVFDNATIDEKNRVINLEGNSDEYQCYKSIIPFEAVDRVDEIKD